MTFEINPARVLFERSEMLYGHFLEHFHRQIYGGVYDPCSPFADERGFRADVIQAIRHINPAVIRWPGGCFVSAYHWRDGVGRNRQPSFDKAWRVEDPNTFGTNEFIELCRALDCEPYICTNAGTGTPEEMSDWVEYCNLRDQGRNARRRIADGYPEPHKVKYWSIGNENYGGWEMGAKGADEWSRYVCESAKMMRRVDPTVSLSAAALSDLDWNVSLLKRCGEYLSWISLHRYWDELWQKNDLTGYSGCMAFVDDLTSTIDQVRGLLTAMGLEKRIKIAFDEWNLRGWHHPNVHTAYQGLGVDEYLKPRDLNDLNASYTMADAVFSACFLNALLRNADIVGMANFAPLVNTRGAIYTHKGGIVLRPTYHVFDLFANDMGDQVLDGWTIAPGPIDLVATRDTKTGWIAVSAINKHETERQCVTLRLPGQGEVSVRTLAGDSPDAYNDVDHTGASIKVNPQAARWTGDGLALTLEPHSVNIIRIKE